MGTGCVGVVPRVRDKVHRLFAVHRDIGFYGQVFRFDRFADKQSVRYIVFSQQKNQPLRNDLGARVRGR